MAAPTRSAMRLLSRRVHIIRQPVRPAAAHHVRCASSRYSNPSRTERTSSDLPSEPSSFVGTAQPEPAVELEPQASVPLDARQAWEKKRQYHLRRMRFAGVGLLLSLAGLAGVLWQIDLDEMEQSVAAEREKKALAPSKHQMDASDAANANFQGKEVQVIGAGDGKRIVAHGAGGVDIELVETGTSSVPHFPRTIFLPGSAEAVTVAAAPNTPGNPGNVSNQEEYTLVGLGIRTVMWIQVYVVGLYIRTQDISTLQEKLIHHVNPIASTLVPAEKETLQQKLLDPTASREIWSELLHVPGLKTAWRVSPTRNTDFGHLRDGFVTGINKRSQEARQLSQQPGGETEFDSEDFGAAVQQFKGIFAGGKAPKGSLLIMRRDADGALDVLYQAKPDGDGPDKKFEKLGSVADERISRLIWLGYLAGNKVSSEAARKGVVDGCIGFASRPVGSVETMVT